MRHFRRLRPVHSPGTRQEKLTPSPLPRKIESAPRPLDDRVEHHEGIYLGAGRRGSVNNMREATVGIIERTYIAGMKLDGRILGEVRRLGGKRLGTPAEHHCRRSERQTAIDPAKAFQQPAAEKTCAAGNENALSADLLPEIARAFQDKLEVGGERVARVCLGGRTRSVPHNLSGRPA